MADEKEIKKGWQPSGEPVETEAVKTLRERFPGSVSCVPNAANEATVIAQKDKIAEILAFLKSEPSLDFDYLSDLTAVHFPDNEKQIMVVYHLFSTGRKDSLRVKLELEDGEACPSVVHIWPAANWMEREAFDLIGVKFEGHPNLKRILLPDDFEGHPLRKEFPLGGAQEQEIRTNRYGKPALLPDDLEAAKKMMEEGKSEY